MTKKAISIILILLLLTSSLPVYAAPSTWAQTGVDQLMEQDLIPADLQSDYQKNITRGEFARLLIPAMEAILFTEIGDGYDYVITKEPFSDTNETNVMKAYSSDIIGGIGNNKFNPNGLITREQVAIMMVNAVDSIGMLSYITKKPVVADDKNISSWAKAYVYGALTNELMNGTGNGNYAPKGNVTREQAILMVNNVVNNYLNAGGIDAHKTSLDTKYQNNLADFKSYMIWNLLGSKSSKADLMSLIGQDTSSLASLFGSFDGEGYAKFINFSLETGGIYDSGDGEPFKYDVEAIDFYVYELTIYHTNGKIIGFEIFNNDAFDGSLSGYQTSYLYEDAVKLLGTTELDDTGGAIVYGEVDGFHITLYFDDITLSSTGVSVVKVN